MENNKVSVYCAECEEGVVTPQKTESSKAARKIIGAKKGLVRIWTGIALILFEISVLYNYFLALENYNKEKIFYKEQGFRFYEIFLQYYEEPIFNWPTLVLGILGIALVVWGYKTYASGKRTTTILHPQKGWVSLVLKCVFILLEVLNLYAYGQVLVNVVKTFSFESITACVNLLQCVVILASHLCMLLYLLFYQGRKPSMAFISSLAFSGSYYLFYELWVFQTYIDSFLADPESLVLIGFFVIRGLILIALARMLYTEKFKVSVVHALGWSLFAVAVIRLIYQTLCYRYLSIGLAEILNLFPPLVYVCLMPLSKEKIIAHDASAATTTVCNSCGYTYGKVIVECPRCAQERRADNSVQIQQPVVLENSNQICFCRKCGEKLLENSRFCRKCGAEIKDVEVDNGQQ